MEASGTCTGETLAPPPAAVEADPVAAVRALLSRAGEADYAQAKLALDAAVDPSLDLAWARRELHRLTEAARALAGPEADEEARFHALPRLLHEAGPWNEHRPFAYDHSDPLGGSIRNKLLPVYLERRLGNCVSMPILFLILGERLGLDLSLAAAPLHILLRWRHPRGFTLNIETTSGATPARDAWLRQSFPMSDLALSNGIYLRSLPRAEAVAHMAMLSPSIWRRKSGNARRPRSAGWCSRSPPPMSTRWSRREPPTPTCCGASSSSATRFRRSSPSTCAAAT